MIQDRGPDWRVFLIQKNRHGLFLVSAWPTLKGWLDGQTATLIAATTSLESAQAVLPYGSLPITRDRRLYLRRPQNSSSPVSDSTSSLSTSEFSWGSKPTIGA